MIPFAETLIAALGPARATAVHQALDGLDRLLDALRVLDEATRLVESVGSTGVKFPPGYRAALANLRERLQRLQ